MGVCIGRWSFPPESTAKLILANLLAVERIITLRAALLTKPLIHCPNYRARLPRDAKEKPLRHRAALERTQLGVIMTGMGMMALRVYWRLRNRRPTPLPRTSPVVLSSACRKKRSRAAVAAIVPLRRIAETALKMAGS